MSNGRRVMCWGMVLWLTEGEYQWVKKTAEEVGFSDNVREATPEEIASFEQMQAEVARTNQEDLDRIMGYFRLN